MAYFIFVFNKSCLVFPHNLSVLNYFLDNLIKCRKNITEWRVKKKKVGDKNSILITNLHSLTKIKAWKTVINKKKQRKTPLTTAWHLRHNKQNTHRHTPRLWCDTEEIKLLKICFMHLLIWFDWHQQDI